MTISCPKCGQQYDVGQEYIGYMLDCETCGGQFLVRQPSRVPLSAARKADVQPVACEREEITEPLAAVTQANENSPTITQSAKPSGNEITVRTKSHNTFTSSATISRSPPSATTSIGS